MLWPLGVGVLLAGLSMARAASSSVTSSASSERVTTSSVPSVVHKLAATSFAPVVPSISLSLSQSFSASSSSLSSSSASPTSAASSPTTVDWRSIRGRTSLDMLPDFSEAGYASSSRDIPVGQDADRTLAPLGRGLDDTARIQAALDRGGVTRLTKGTFVLASDPLILRKTGSVLQGAGPTKTRLLIGGNPRTALRIGESGLTASNVTRKLMIADPYVGVGARNISVSNTTGLRKGDEIFVRRTVSDTFLALTDMDDLIRNGDPQIWLPPGSPLDQMRTITKVANGSILITPPLVDSVSAAVGDNGAVIVYDRPATAVSEVGIENLGLQIADELNVTSITAPSIIALKVSAWAQDVWIHQVSLIGFMTAFQADDNSRRITLDSVLARRTSAVPLIAGLPADFIFQGSTQILMRSCRNEATNNSAEAFAIMTQARSNGPYVILNHTALDVNGGIEPHQRWATGLLVDGSNVKELIFRNRRTFGSGQGWAANSCVAWNVTANEIEAQSPPVGANFIFGSAGLVSNVTSLAQFGGVFNTSDPHSARAIRGSDIDPPSLFTAQLEARLGKKEVLKLHTTFIRAAASVPATSIDQWTTHAAFEWPDASIATVAQSSSPPSFAHLPIIASIASLFFVALPLYYPQ